MAIKMKPIPMTEIMMIGDDRVIGLTQEGGTIPDGIAKDGTPRDLEYASGSAILAFRDGRHICGPIDMRGIRAFALEVAAGNQRAVTEPSACIRLATALLAIVDMLEFAGSMDLVVVARAEAVA
ncbi:hypothetical protein [Rhizobium sp. RU36D]|uniref:hypothetical protein n=1 Tax=Rhizobium sp. RU36D TaxID=1907415 RepID=UPI0009D885DB|nr:hypothetical protein [Rhizobium sp. RU36D]SMD18616.1 hypothetical protein SAMN05880593_13550 [Rhizobium sp. RU36D]